MSPTHGGVSKLGTVAPSSVPNVGSVAPSSVPNIGTVAPSEGREHEALFSKTRSAVLALLFARPHERFHVRAVVRAAGVGTGAVQRELRTLERAGLIVRTRDRGRVCYQANASSRVFTELRALIVKTAGRVAGLTAALERLPGIHVAFLRGMDLHVICVGPPEAVVRALDGLDVHLSVWTPEEWQRRVIAGDPIATESMRAPKTFLIGGQRRLARAAGEDRLRLMRARGLL